MKIWTVLIFAIISTSSWCEDVIDLGSLEIDGESWRPMITYSESSHNVAKAMTYQLSNNAKLYASNLEIDKNSGYPVLKEYKFSPITDKEKSATFDFNPKVKGQ